MDYKRTFHSIVMDLFFLLLSSLLLKKKKNSIEFLGVLSHVHIHTHTSII